MTFQQWIEEDFGGAVETPHQKAQAHYGSKKAAYDFGQGEMLSDLRDALGWQGGTVADALAEVRRLKTSEERAWIDGYNMAVRYVQLQPELFDESKRPWLNDYLATSKPIGQGVAALLPEHGEAVCTWHESGTLLRAKCDDKHRGHSQRPEICPYCGKPTVFV